VIFDHQDLRPAKVQALTIGLSHRIAPQGCNHRTTACDGLCAKAGKLTL
jgi:hypothetical protein